MGDRVLSATSCLLQPYQNTAGVGTQLQDGVVVYGVAFIVGEGADVEGSHSQLAQTCLSSDARRCRPTFRSFCCIFLFEPLFPFVASICAKFSSCPSARRLGATPPTSIGVYLHLASGDAYSRGVSEPLCSSGYESHAFNNCSSGYDDGAGAALCRLVALCVKHHYHRLHNLTNALNHRHIGEFCLSAPPSYSVVTWYAHE